LKLKPRAPSADAPQQKHRKKDQLERALTVVRGARPGTVGAAVKPLIEKAVKLSRYFGGVDALKIRVLYEQQRHRTLDKPATKENIERFSQIETAFIQTQSRIARANEGFLSTKERASIIQLHSSLVSAPRKAFFIPAPRKAFFIPAPKSPSHIGPGATHSLKRQQREQALAVVGASLPGTVGAAIRSLMKADAMLESIGVSEEGSGRIGAFYERERHQLDKPATKANIGLFSQATTNALRTYDNDWSWARGIYGNEHQDRVIGLAAGKGDVVREIAKQIGIGIAVDIAVDVIKETAKAAGNALKDFFTGTPEPISEPRSPYDRSSPDSQRQDGQNNSQPHESQHSGDGGGSLGRNADGTERTANDRVSDASSINEPPGRGGA
jgi:hypothetical protein